MIEHDGKVLFTEEELRCKGSGLLRFHPGFLEELKDLRLTFGEPMFLSSACRAASHNAAVGGHPKSLHIGDLPQHPGQLGTLAVDVIVTDGARRGKLFSMAWNLGWSIGWNAKKGFLHLDRRDFIGFPQTTFDY